MKTARAALSIAVMFLALFLQACTAKELYVFGQGWQISECAKKLGKAEYDRCMGDANIPYDSYKRQSK